MKWVGTIVFLCAGLFSVIGSYGQGMDREEWKNRFEETLRVGIKEEKIPLFVVQRMERVLAGMQQEGWTRALDPSIVAKEALAFAGNFDHDLRRGASPVLAELLYRQMSRNLVRGGEERGDGNRTISFEILRERVQDRSSGKDNKDKMRLSFFARKSRPLSTPEEGHPGGAGGSSGSGGVGGG